MPQNTWSSKRERQYQHVKDSVRSRGGSKGRAEEIAARTVNKERAQHGEAKEASRTSLKDMSAPKRGGERSHSGAAGRTYAQLYKEARDKGVDGRSKMNKSQLEKALAR